MKRLLILAGLLIPVTVTATDFSPKPPQPLRTIDSFSQYEVGKFPISFKTYPLQRSKAMEVYTVQEEGGNKFLHASDDKDISVQTFRRIEWGKTYPNLSWRWRALTLPKGAAENNKATNDSGCGVYVVFGGYTGNVLKYVWSTTLPDESIHEKKPNTFYFVVKQSGAGSVGQWVTENVNVIEDYKKAFHKDPEDEPSGIGVLTDGNATHTPAACDYDDFRISMNPF